MNRRMAKSATQPARKSLTAVSLSIAALFAVPAAHAFELKLEDGWKGSLDTTMSLGTSMRMQSADPGLFSGENGTRVGTSGGTGGSNTDSGNLNWDKGDQFSTLFKVTSDLSLSKGQMGAFARVKAWYDYALEDQEVRAGHHGTNWALNSKLSDSGYDRLQKFSGIALLDAYVYNTFDVAGKPLQLRLGNQVINWGESLFIQGINQINPIDLSALRKPGAEVKEAFLPITALSANLGLGDGKSLEAFYQFRWTPSNIDSCGAYFGVVETQLTTKAGKPCSTILTTLPGLSNFDGAAAGQFLGMADGREGEDGQFGVAFRFLAEPIDTEFGVYATQISSRTPFIAGRTGTNMRNPALVATLNGLQGGLGTGLAQNFLNYYPGLAFAAASGVPATTAAINGALAVATGGGATPALGSWNYPDKINIFGVSASTNISGWSLGAEFSTTNDQPAQINAGDILAGILRGFGPFGARATAATNQGAGTALDGFDRVRKSQFQLNAVRLFPRLLGSAQAVVVGEAAFQKADLGTDQRYGRAFIFGTGWHPSIQTATGATEAVWCEIPQGNPQQDGCRNDGYATENSWGYRLRLGLEYPNFLNTGATLFPTFSFSHDVSGHSVDNQFIEDRKVYGASFRVNIQRVHNIELSYIQYGDSAKYDPFRDRDFMSLVFSTSF